MEKTIAAIATPNAAGGIGIVRISGNDAVSVAERVFRAAGGTKLASLPGYSCLFGTVYNGNEPVDQAVALLFRAPRSYTGEDVVELQCHGGLFLMQEILRLVLAAGATAAGPGEFTKRAFLNGKLDLSEAESVMNLISAHGEQAANAAYHTLEGTLSKEIRSIADGLIAASARMAAWADYPDEIYEEELNYDTLLPEFEEARQRLQTLVSRFDAGQIISEGITTAIVGKPNVGKSTLMNRLLQRNRSIVTSVAGTTRDVIEETARIGNVVLRLSDTAGLHESSDTVEAIGIQMAREKLTHSDLILAVFDGSEALSPSDFSLLEEVRDACNAGRKKAVGIINKADLGNQVSESSIAPFVSAVITLSANDPGCYDKMKQLLENLLGTAEFDSSAAVLANERQLLCCQKAIDALSEAIFALSSGLTMDAVNVSVEGAISPLLELTGEQVSDTVIEEVFATFCVGK
ncbi:MAG TPA: tRNA uridine-5-carboxymethylaminomethyl(34) synthesis GTPase MnmE [Clostridiales bacterium]|nr:tRNA uridine-5-carboxymethylaminomethyl(34) synthesis GTPase MnmE [Clostridiales bacterium]